jgi:hypothetical protein
MASAQCHGTLSWGQSQEVQRSGKVSRVYVLVGGFGGSCHYSALAILWLAYNSISRVPWDTKLGPVKGGATLRYGIVSGLSQRLCLCSVLHMCGRLRRGRCVFLNQLSAGWLCGRLATASAQSMGHQAGASQSRCNADVRFDGFKFGFGVLEAFATRGSALGEFAAGLQRRQLYGHQAGASQRRCNTQVMSRVSLYVVVYHLASVLPVLLCCNAGPCRRCMQQVAWCPSCCCWCSAATRCSTTAVAARP